MQRLSFKGWLAVFLVSTAILVFANSQDRAQAWQEPMLGGIPHSELDTWSFRYGPGAFHGGVCPLMPVAGICNLGPQHFVGPVGPRPPFKGRARNCRK